MKADGNPKLTTLVLLVFLLVLAQGWHLLRRFAVSAPTWDYLVEAPSDTQLAARLQQLGSSGWQLVTATREPSGYQLIFKRQSSPRLAVNQSRLLP